MKNFSPCCSRYHRSSLWIHHHPASSGSFSISNEWSRTRKDLGAKSWQHTVSVNQLHRRWRGWRRATVTCAQWRETLVHDEQRGSGSHQRHGRHRTADVSSLKGKANITTRPRKALERNWSTQKEIYLTLDLALLCQNSSISIGRLICICPKLREAAKTHPQAAFSQAAASEWG